MKIYESSFTKISFDESKSLMINERSNSEISEEEYRANVLVLAEFAEKYRPEKVLMDNRKMTYIVVPEVQKWVNEEIFPRLLKAGVVKGAFVESEDLFSGVSVEQTLEEPNARQFELAWFSDREKAEKWVTS